MGILKVVESTTGESKGSNATHLQDSNTFSFNKHKLLVCSTSEGHRIVPFELIRSIRSVSNYTILSLENDESIILSKTLKRVEVQLDNTFIRVHNSHIINLLRVRVFDNKNNEILLDDGSRIPVARSRKIKLKSIFNTQST